MSQPRRARPVSRAAPSTVLGNGLGLATVDLVAGHRLGRYVIRGRLGQGGMGVVYEAHDTQLDRIVALKFIASATTSGVGPALLRRFLAEARAAARLNHPNAVAVYGTDEWNGVPYLVMELVRGRSAQDCLDERGAFPWPEATQVIAAACRGLAAAHAVGLVHRDIKPGNILIPDGREAKLADFGLAKVADLSTALTTGTGVVLGTPYYMSPEQCRSEPVDDCSDIYSLGATYYALLTGGPPYPLGQPVQIMFAHCSRPTPDPREADAMIPDACADVVLRAMSKRQDRRYHSSAAMLAALESIAMAGKPRDTRTSASLVPRERRVDECKPPRTAWGLSRRRWLPLAVGAAATVAVGVTVNLTRKPGADVREPLPPDWAANVDRVLASKEVAQASGLVAQLLPRRQEAGVGLAIDRLQWLMLSRGSVGDAGLLLPAGGTVAAVACSPDHRWLAAGNSNGTGGVTVWDLTRPVPPATRWPKASGKLIDVHAVAFSHDGSMLAAGCSGGLVRLWRLAEGSESVLSMGRSSDVITVLAFAPDGRLATVTSDADGAGKGPQIVRVWDSKARRELYQVRPSDETVLSIAFSPGNDILATAGSDGRCRLWNAGSGAPLRNLPTGFTTLVSLAFAPGGKTLVAAGYNRTGPPSGNGLRFWNLVSTSTDVPPLVESTLLRCVAFSPDGRLLMCGTGSQVELRNAASRGVVARLGSQTSARYSCGLAFSAGGGMLVTGTADRSVRVWDVSQIGEDLR